MLREPVPFACGELTFDSCCRARGPTNLLSKPVYSRTLAAPVDVPTSFGFDLTARLVSGVSDSECCFLLCCTVKSSAGLPCITVKVTSEVGAFGTMSGVFTAISAPPTAQVSASRCLCRRPHHHAARTPLFIRLRPSLMKVPSWSFRRLCCTSACACSALLYFCSPGGGLFGGGSKKNTPKAGGGGGGAGGPPPDLLASIRVSETDIMWLFHTAVPRSLFASHRKLFVITPQNAWDTGVRVFG